MHKKYYVLILKDKDLMKTLLPKASKDYQNLDVAILHKAVFEHILNLSPEEQASGSKVDFVKGNKETLKKLEDKKYSFGFLVNPPLMKEVFATARNGEVMPQKSTYFYPKVFSGIVIYSLEE